MLEHLIPARRQFPADDPIFTLNAEAQKRKAAGEDVLNATLGALATMRANWCCWRPSRRCGAS